MCTVVNLRQHRYDVYIGRAGKGQPDTFGNPFRVGVDGAQGECVKKFEDWFYSDDGAFFRSHVDATIKPGDVLGCFCKPLACHGDVIAAYVNNNYQRP